MYTVNKSQYIQLGWLDRLNDPISNSSPYKQAVIS